MDKQAYLNLLKDALNDLDPNEVDEIVTDYDAHFEYAYEDGLEDEAIISKLGTPEDVANKYLPKGEEISEETVENETVAEEVYEDQSMTQNAEPEVTSQATQSEQVVYTNQTKQVVKGRSAAGSVIIACLLLFLNVTFIIGPFIAVWGVWFSVFVCGIAIAAEGIKMIVLASTITDYSAGLSELTLIAQIGFYLSFGSCLTLLMVKLAKGMGLLTKKYILWNVKVVKGEA